MLVQIGGASYLLPAENVECALKLPRELIFPIPFDEKGRLRGIFEYRGSLEAILNCGGLRSESDISGNAELTAVLLKSADKRFAILVDSADAVISEADNTNAQKLDVQQLYSGEADASD